jgi:CheY-like chemotaxis protein
VNRMGTLSTSTPAVYQILVVEDDKSLRSVLTEYLYGSGNRVLSAGDHGEALQLAQRNREYLALLLTDTVLLGKSGHHIANAIKAEGRRRQM